MTQFQYKIRHLWYFMSVDAFMSTDRSGGSFTFVFRTVCMVSNILAVYTEAGRLSVQT